MQDSIVEDKTMAQDLKCPKCQGEMVQGFIPDFNDGGSKSVSTWVEGQAKKSWWSGTKVSSEGQIPIAAFRCQGCGYLEFYADEKFAAQ
jgi:hypothetical protein